MGEAAVGKTTLAKVFSGQNFSEKRMMTRGVDYVQAYKRPTRLQGVEGAEDNKIVIWDTAGQERYRSLAPTFYKQAHGVVVCFDLTSRKSFEAVTATWIKSISDNCIENVITVIFGCKADLTSQRQVTTEEAEVMACEHNMEYFETSAKTGENVEEAF